MGQVKVIAISNTDFLAKKSISPYFRDALAVPLSKQLKPAQIQINIFSHMPQWVGCLMKLRNRIVAVFGFEVALESFASPQDKSLSVGDQAGFMTVIHCDDHQIISFAEDKHMQFYLSVSKHGKQAVISTLVNKKTWIGRIYVTAIIPFHWCIARAVLNNAVKNKRI